MTELIINPYQIGFIGLESTKDYLKRTGEMVWKTFVSKWSKIGKRNKKWEKWWGMWVLL